MASTTALRSKRSQNLQFHCWGEFAAFHQVPPATCRDLPAQGRVGELTSFRLQGRDMYGPNISASSNLIDHIRART